MDHDILISPTSNRRPAPEAIGTEPGDRYTRLLNRTRSRPSSRPRHPSVVERSLGDQRDMPIGPLDENNTLEIEETSRSLEEQGETNAPSDFHAPGPTGHPVYVSVLPFGPSHRNSSLATTSIDIPTPPPMYT
ncbi:unnamed protein product, partial [Rhizoctonia solani]